MCERIFGLTADLRADRRPSIAPWDLVGTLAAEIHRVPTEPFDWLPGYATRREHGAARLRELPFPADAPDPDVRRALLWMRSHLPPADPARTVHGDLLGHDLLVLPKAPPAVLVWEGALLGDPALDLAIVTRGVRRPFRSPQDMRRLLESHGERAVDELRVEDVRFHEIAMHLTWYGNALSGATDAEPAADVLARLRNLLSWVGA